MASQQGAGPTGGEAVQWASDRWGSGGRPEGPEWDSDGQLGERARGFKRTPTSGAEPLERGRSLA